MQWFQREALRLENENQKMRLEIRGLKMRIERMAEERQFYEKVARDGKRENIVLKGKIAKS